MSHRRIPEKHYKEFYHFLCLPYDLTLSNNGNNDIAYFLNMKNQHSNFLNFKV